MRQENFERLAIEASRLERVIEEGYERHFEYRRVLRELFKKDTSAPFSLMADIPTRVLGGNLVLNLHIEKAVSGKRETEARTSYKVSVRTRIKDEYLSVFEADFPVPSEVNAEFIRSQIAYDTGGYLKSTFDFITKNPDLIKPSP